MLDTLKKIIGYTAVFLLITAKPVLADPVYISARNSEGQGFAFKISRQECLVLTAYHVLNEELDEYKIVDRNGYVFTAHLISFSEKLDLALLSLGISNFNNTTCNTSPWRPLRDIRPLLQSDDEFPIWINLITSPAGGAARKKIGEYGFLHDELLLIPVKDEQNLVFEGVSGSIVHGSRLQFGMPQSIPDRGSLSLHGDILGVLLGRNATHLKIVPAHRVLEFIAQSLNPLDYSKIVINPEDFEITNLFRGPFYNPSSVGGRADFIGDLDTLSIEFDIGERDKVIKGIEVKLNDALEGREFLQIRALTSQKRPPSNFWPSAANVAKHWKAAYCSGKINSYRRRVDDADSNEQLCVFSTPLIARGLRVSISGPLDKVASIRIIHD